MGGLERVHEVPPPEPGQLAAPLQGRRLSTGPQRVPAPQSSLWLLTQDEGPSSGKDRGCVLNPTEGGSEVSRGDAGLESGEGRLRDRERGSRTAANTEARERS